MRVGRTYYAYSSGAGGRYLGVLTSTDLVHWTIHKHWSTHEAPWLGGPDPRHDPSIPAEIRESTQSSGDMWNLNDALVRPAAWGLRVAFNAWEQRSYWAVGVIQIGKHWYAYAGVKNSTRFGDGTVDPDGFGRYCLTVVDGADARSARSATSPAAIRSIATPTPAAASTRRRTSTRRPARHWLTWKASGRRSRRVSPGIRRR